MISVKENDYYPIILYCYTEDVNLQKYASYIGNAEERAKQELDCLNNANDTFEFFVIKENDEVLGYYGKEVLDEADYLTSFFVRKPFRNRKYEIWNHISSHFSKPFYSGLYSINKRAIRYFEEVGGELIANIVADNKSAVIFKFGE